MFVTYDGPMITTPRLHIRVMREADAPVVAEYRSDPQIALFQDWPMPYTLEMTQARLVEQEHRTELVAGEWTQLAVELHGEVIGDLAGHLHADGRVMELGYTFRAAFHGHGYGYATEAANALVDHVMATTEVHRVEASLDPENIASMRVLEALGMQFESLSRQSYALRGGYVDDLRYAMLRADREAWLARPRHTPTTVELVTIDPDDSHRWAALRTHHSQERFVSPMAKSFRNALFPEVVDGAPVVPWLRGVLADGEPAAFVMLADVTEHHPEPYLWRLLVDRMHQRRGIGDAVLAMLRSQLAAAGHRSLLTSWVDGPGGPRPFYERLGFQPTGNMLDGEVEARLTW